MRLIQYEILTKLGTFKRLGTQINDNIIDLNLAYVKYLAEETNKKQIYSLANIIIPPNMLSFLKGEDSSFEEAKMVHDYVSNLLSHDEKIMGPKNEQISLQTEKIRMIEPLNPILIIDFLTFETHYKQGLHLITDYDTWKKTPIAYKKNPTTVIGPFDDVIIPSSITRWLDYEVEFGIVIGKKGKNIPEDEALDYVAGYTVFNDFSARDIELPEIMLRLGPFKSKDFDTAGAMGPCIVTSDELPGHPCLDMECRVNGTTVQKGNTKDMHWKVDQLVSYTSTDQTIYPGTVILSGNPGKVKGVMRKAERLRDGDAVETEIEKIGLMIYAHGTDVHEHCFLKLDRMNFEAFESKIGIRIKEFGFISLISLVSILFNFGTFDQDSTQYTFMALYFIGQPAVEITFSFSHIALLLTFIRLIRPLVPFLAGWLNYVFYFGHVPVLSFASGYWQLPFGIINSIFSFLASIFLYKLVMHFTNDSKKSIVAILLLNFSDIMFFNSMILIEGATIFFSIFMVYLIICKPFEDSYLNSITLGITIGLAGLTRETLLITGVILFLSYSIYKFRDLRDQTNLYKFLLVILIVIVIYGGYILIIGIQTFLDCIYIFFNLNLSNILSFFIPKSIFSRFLNILNEIGITMVNIYKYLLTFFGAGIIKIFFGKKSKKEHKILIGIFLISFFIPLLISPFIVERFFFPFYLITTYISVVGIFALDDSDAWVSFIAVSISLLNIIFVIYFYPYTLIQQLTNFEIKSVFYYLILVYLGLAVSVFIYKYVVKKDKKIEIVDE